MTTLAANKERTYSLTHLDFNELPAINADILYWGSAIGKVVSTGYMRPLVAGDRFQGFADAKADNNAGAAGDINVNVRAKGRVQLSVAGATITDVGQPVYATDDDTFVFNPVGASFIGFVHRFVSAGVVIVAFDADGYRDPYGNHTARLEITADTTLDATHTGKLLWVSADGKFITLPAIATGLDGVLIVNGGAFGTIAVNISPNASDMILGPDIIGADNKDLINTKATANRGDRVVIGGNDADGYAVQEISGTWAREA